tara:strand:- start:534 stop:725 length:192 start_codon:yes stop_codon:yes gene_type:complete
MKPLSVDIISSVKKLIFVGEINTVRVVDTNDVVYFVPMNEENTDYVQVLAWDAIDGNTIADPD